MSSKRTPLHEAAARGDLTACKAEMGKAVVSGGPDAVRKLLETPTQGFEETALHLASQNGHSVVVEELIRAGADVNAQRSGGYSALHLAKTEAVVEMLLKHGINKALTSVAGQTAAQQCLGGRAVQQFIGTAKVERATRHERWGIDSPAPAPAPSNNASSPATSATVGDAGSQMAAMLEGLQGDPDVLAALKNPRCKEAYDDVMTNGMNAGMKYVGDPECAPVIQKVAEKMGMSGMIPTPPAPTPSPTPASSASDPLGDLKSQIAELEAQKATAAAAEDFEEAGRLKKKIDQVWIDAGMRPPPAAKPRTAEQAKSDGNQAVKHKQYAEAAEYYSEAVALSADGGASTSVYYANRALCYIKLKNFQLDANYAKGHLRAGQALAQLQLQSAESNSSSGGHFTEEPLDLLERALELDPALKRAPLLCEVAEAALRCGQTGPAIMQSQAACKLDGQCVLAQIIRGEALLAYGKPNEAMGSFEMAAMTAMRAGNNDRALQERTAAGLRAGQKVQIDEMKARRRGADGERKDYYSILGVSKDASDTEIRRGYKKMALQWHPDKHRGGGEAEAEAKFKEVGEAYAVVGDAKRRKGYDAGSSLADFEGLEGLFSADGIDPELVFRLFKMQEAKNGGPTEALES